MTAINKHCATSITAFGLGLFRFPVVIGTHNGTLGKRWPGKIEIKLYEGPTYQPADTSIKHRDIQNDEKIGQCHFDKKLTKMTKVKRTVRIKNDKK